MAAVADNATLYTEQLVDGLRPFNNEYYKLSQFFGADYAIGPMCAMFSELATVTGGGGAGDTVDLMKLPNGTYILGGWIYTEDALIADTNSADLGVIYEDGDGTDDADCLAEDDVDYLCTGARHCSIPCLLPPQRYYVKVYRPDGLPSTCSSYQLRFANSY